ncbi:hypothetical protein AVT69_gp346 [Pseudomonas phage PhiPA3]|uniref:Uncharacterized protein 348 n=1 Tax=Pseudomonas phage PhiPA3 TaxID=998086 RepID=F8SJI2_BPPA3|nr:hypothetical protein AVT69_gp346 [Pseudomonas phage PhiPA3]AEH03771.1 hypothetical protein [Pseudomonas phage PhiPA3]
MSINLIREDCRYALKYADLFVAAALQGSSDFYIDSCMGMLAAHGDKSEQYRDYWVSRGLDYKRAQLVYLLTFTKLLGATPKHHSKEWVLTNYHNYVPIFEQLERDHGTEQTHQTSS